MGEDAHQAAAAGVQAFADASPSDRKWRAALEAAGVGVWDWDLRTGACTYSPEWKVMLGYPAEATVDSYETWSRLIHPDDREAAEAAGALHIAGETPIAEAEFRLLHRNGQYIWVYDRGKVIEWDADGIPTRMVGIQSNIDARKRQEQDLALLAERIGLAMDSAGIGLWQIDLTTGAVVWDHRLHKLYGTDPDSFSGTSAEWLTLVHPADLARVRAEVEKAISRRSPLDQTFRIVRSNGEIRHIRGLARCICQEHGAEVMIGSSWDVTEQVSAAEALSAEKERLRITLQSIADAVICTDVFGRVSFMNIAAETLTGYVEPLALGQTLDVIYRPIHEETETALPAIGVEAIRRRSAVEQSEPAVLVRRDGSRRAIRDIASPVIAANGEVVGAVLVVQDVTAARALQRDLARAATHDALTGLKNRAYFSGAVGQAIADAASTGAPAALLFVDLDRFKIINDIAGHNAGDAVLRQVAATLLKLTRSEDVVARIGGDEFAILLPGSGAPGAESCAQSIVEAIEDIRFGWGDKVHDIGASVGVSLIGPDTRSAEAVLAEADVACYAAKAAGRGRVSVYRPDAGEAFRHLTDIRLAAGMKQALKENRFQLHAQEIRDLDRPLARGRRLEVLARMIADDGSIVPPGSFIPAAERFEMMGGVDRWVLRSVIHDYGPAIMDIPDLTVAVNLSANSLSDPMLWPDLMRELKSGPLSPCRLTLEITETAVINNFTAADRFLEEARAFGCRISLDDFGSGVSSFAYLKRFQVDAIKIDAAFVRQLPTSPVDRTIVRLINDLAGELDMDAIAEGIEDTETVDILTSLGVRYGQGFLFHRPQPLRALLQEIGGETGVQRAPVRSLAG